MIYVPNLANRKQGLEWLDMLGKGKHLEGKELEGNLTHLKKACAMIIEPYSNGEMQRGCHASCFCNYLLHLFKSIDAPSGSNLGRYRACASHEPFCCPCSLPRSIRTAHRALPHFRSKAWK